MRNNNNIFFQAKFILFILLTSFILFLLTILLLSGNFIFFILFLECLIFIYLYLQSPHMKTGSGSLLLTISSVTLLNLLPNSPLYIYLIFCLSKSFLVLLTLSFNNCKTFNANFLLFFNLTSKIFTILFSISLYNNSSSYYLFTCFISNLAQYSILVISFSLIILIINLHFGYFYNFCISFFLFSHTIILFLPHFTYFSITLLIIDLVYYLLFIFPPFFIKEIILTFGNIKATVKPFLVILLIGCPFTLNFIAEMYYFFSIYVLGNGSSYFLLIIYLLTTVIILYVFRFYKFSISVKLKTNKLPSLFVLLISILISTFSYLVLFYNTYICLFREDSNWLEKIISFFSKFSFWDCLVSYFYDFVFVMTYIGPLLLIWVFFKSLAKILDIFFGTLDYVIIPSIQYVAELIVRTVESCTNILCVILYGGETGNEDKEFEDNLITFFISCVVPFFFYYSILTIITFREDLTIFLFSFIYAILISYLGLIVEVVMIFSMVFITLMSILSYLFGINYTLDCLCEFSILPKLYKFLDSKKEYKVIKYLLVFFDYLYNLDAKLCKFLNHNYDTLFRKPQYTYTSAAIFNLVLSSCFLSVIAFIILMLFIVLLSLLTKLFPAFFHKAFHFNLPLLLYQHIFTYIIFLILLIFLIFNIFLLFFTICSFKWVLKRFFMTNLLILVSRFRSYFLTRSIKFLLYNLNNISDKLRDLFKRR